MSFKPNTFQQLSFTDSLSGLTERERKALEKSWAKIFADEIFPAIDEERFAVLYSTKASRPNTPVNVIVGALIIKELFDYSDDEMVENLMLDLHLQYALHTTSFEEQPLSDKTLSRFRKRCYDYETLCGVDLYKDCVKDLGGKIAKIMQLNGRVRRMDSMMIESNIRKLSRMELIYTCISKLVVYLKKQHPDKVTEELDHYTDPNDFNRVFYHHRSSDSEKRTAGLIKDMDTLAKVCGDACEDVTEYELFLRCLSEQTVVEEGERRLRTREDGIRRPTQLLNPSDPDATYRIKGNSEYRGYVANLEETVGKNGSVVTDYRYEQNTYSDSQFLKDYLEESEQHTEKVTLVTDGGYSGMENREKAAQKNVELITTKLSGTDTPDIYAEFQFDETGKKVLQCPAGHRPQNSNYIRQTEQCLISMSREYCTYCPHKDQCRPKIYKRVAKLQISKKSSDRAKLQRTMCGEDFLNYTRLRNGIETVPSNLRMNYHMEKLPRGKQRGKFFFGSKIAALNFRKLFNFCKGWGNYAQNPVLV